jgi:uncharacterized membrane protein YkvA (DUF1232 family)
MTIRRLLRLTDSKVIPDKYQVHISQLLVKDSKHSTAKASVEHQDLASQDMISKLIVDAEKAENTDKVKVDLEKKIKKESFQSTILNFIKTLRKYAFMKGHSKEKLIALGAILYFINPFDIVPDALPGIGYIDDIGVMSIAVQQITMLIKGLNKEP